MRAVTFDFGQTLAELDHDFLQRRAHTFGAELDPSASRAATVSAWHAYGTAKALGHARAWQAMILEYLRAGGVHKIRAEEADAQYAEKIAQLLWDGQPTHNLWRKPIAGMFELAAELAARQVPMGIISNSEGHLAELLEELGYGALFPVVIDSGRVGVDKPNPRIFQLAAEALAVDISQIVHVGDAWEADVMGARAAGAQAIWYAPTDDRALPEGVIACRNAEDLRQALRTFGVG
ncbi:MAG TPA: HAD family hydrolase [Polyangiaceae bacterium]|nr:HAD family hydrolase [Polyangiaceae bacterium]